MVQEQSNHTEKPYRSPIGNGTVGTVFQTTPQEGAGDATLSPPHVCGHAAGAALGAVRIPAAAPVPAKAFESTLPRHPLDVPGIVKVALGQAASAALAAVGPHHLAIITKADCTAPVELRGRAILLCLPLDKATATAACEVALGRMKATKPKTTKPAANRATLPLAGQQPENQRLASLGNVHPFISSSKRNCRSSHESERTVEGSQ